MQSRQNRVSRTDRCCSKKIFFEFVFFGEWQN